MPHRGGIEKNVSRERLTGGREKRGEPPSAVPLFNATRPLRGFRGGRRRGRCDPSRRTCKVQGAAIVSAPIRLWSETIPTRAFRLTVLVSIEKIGDAGK